MAHSATPAESQPDPSRLTIRPVTADDWPAFERLFESRGAPKNCWCMVWRKTPEEAKRFSAAMREDKTDGKPAASSRARKAAMKGRIEGGVPVGLLAYDGDEAVAWCSIAPRPTYRGLGGPADHDDAPDSVWSIACFFVIRAWRGMGLTGLLIDAARDYAQSQGARLLEAYPVPEDAPSYRFMGFTKTFDAHGFEKAGTAGHRRVVMRKAIDE